MRTLPTYIPSPPQGVWHLGPVPIRAYALCIIAGIVAALVLTDRRWAARGGERGVVYDIALWAVPFGLIGGRLYHLATDWRTYFGDGGVGLAAALRIWDGGLGIWGAIALGGVGAWIACRRRGIPLPAFADALAPGLILAQAIGRLGNYFNQELYGRRTSVPWGLEIFYRRDPTGFEDVHSLDGVSTGQLYSIVQPTFLYELLWNLLVFAALIYLDRKFKLGHGRLFAIYVAGYCVGRFVVELLRDDTATHIAGIRINSFTSTFVFIGAVVYIILAPKGREDPDSLPSGEDDYALVGAADVPDVVEVVDAPGVVEVVDGAPEPDSAPEVAEPGVPDLAVAEPDEADAEAEAEEPEAEPESVEPEVSEADADEEAEPEDPDAADAEAAVLEDSAEIPDVADDEAAEQDVADAAVELAADEPVAAELEAEEPATDEPEVDEAEADESDVEESESEDSEPEEPEVEQADESDEVQVEAYSAEEVDEAEEADAVEAEDPESEDSEAEDPAADEPEPAETTDADREPTEEAAPDAAPKRWSLRRRKQR